MGLTQRLTDFNARLTAKLERKRDLEKYTASLQAKIESVENLLEGNAVLLVPPDYVKDVVRVIRNGITATDRLHPVTVTLLVRWCNSQEDLHA